MNGVLLARTNRLQSAAFSAGIAGLLACGIGAFVNTRQFFISYLFAVLFWLGLSLGCLCVAMIHHLTGGRWGDVSRRFMEAGYMTLPVMGILFLPLFAGLRQIYEWAGQDGVAHIPALAFKAHYLNATGFAIRAVVFFAVWIWMASSLRKWSRQQDETTDVAPTQRARSLSGPGVIIYALTVTFAWIDWLMSLEPDWYSTMAAIIICAGQILATFALVILMLSWFRNQSPFAEVVEEGQFHQLGNFLLTFVMFWTYVCFGQLLIIWSGNLPKEIGWYLHRVAGGWNWVATFLALFNFFLPFFLLLFRASKKKPQALRVLAGVVFVCQLINSWWLVEPSFFKTGLHIHWMDFAAPVGIGGMWLAAFAWQLKRAPLLAQNDPRISYAFAHAE